MDVQFTFTRNLTVGSKGADVMKLQELLNSNPQNVVSTSGAGSRGSETLYFGPATKRAVAKFQDLYSAEVLTPAGLTKGTGYFGPSTRAKANSLCSGTTTTRGTTSTSGSSNYGDVIVAGGLNVRGVRQPRNGYAVANAQRVPFTNFSLTAGSSDILVEGVKVQLKGLARRNAFDSVALIDRAGSQLGNSRGLNSRNEATIGGRFYVGRGQTVELTVVGNIASGASSGVALFDVVEILANTQVGGSLPVSGASHSLSDALDLGYVQVEQSTSGVENVAIGEDNVRFAEFTLEVKGGGDEDGYLRSITFEQKGSISNDDIEDLIVRVDGRDSYRASVNGDRYTVVFSGRGIEMQEGEGLDISIEGAATDGYQRTIKFELDNASDVYVVGATSGYGLPVSTAKADSDGNYAWGLAEGREWTVTLGESSTGNERFLSTSDHKIRARDNQIIGAFELELEGEAIDIDGTTFTVTISKSNGLFGANVDDLEVSDIRLVDHKTGRTLAEADDFFDIRSSGNANEQTYDVTLGSSYTLPTGDLDLVIVADLDRDILDGTVLKVTTFEWGDAEGVNTGHTLSTTDLENPNALSLGTFTVDGDEVSISLARRVESDIVVDGSTEVEFAVIKFDASDSEEDVEFEEVFFDVTLGGTHINTSVDPNVTTTPAAKITDLRNCDLVTADSNRNRLGGTVSNRLSSATGIQFNFRRALEVRAGRSAEVSVRCDVDDDTLTGATFQFVLDEENDVDYRLGGDRERLTLSEDSAETVTVSSAGTVVASTVAESSMNIAVGDGSSSDFVKVGKLELQASNEDFNFESLTIKVDALSGNEENLVNEVQIRYGSQTETESVRGSGTDATGVNVAFESLGWTIDEGRRANIEVYASFNALGRGDTSGVAVHFSTGAYTATGEASRNDVSDATNSGVLGVVKTFKSLPVFSASSENNRLTGGTATLYEFAVTADGYELALDKITASITVSAATLTEVRLYAYTDSGRRNGAENTTADAIIATTASTSGTVAFDFTNPIFFQEGDTVYFSIRGTVATATDDSIVTKLVGEPFDSTTQTGLVSATSLGNVVFSPNTAETNRVDATTTDWYAAKGTDILSVSDFASWVLE